MCLSFRVWIEDCWADTWILLFTPSNVHNSLPFVRRTIKDSRVALVCVLPHKSALQHGFVYVSYFAYAQSDYYQSCNWNSLDFAHELLC